MSIDEATGLIPVSESKRPKRAPEEHFDGDAEWLVLQGDAAMGERGTLQSTVSQLEHGGPTTGVPSSDLYNEQQLGWGKTAVGLVEKYRWLSSARALLTQECWKDLVLRYTALPAMLRSDEGFGAKKGDECPSVEDIQKLGALETGKPTAFHVRNGTEGQMAEFSALALYHCEDANKLVQACRDPQKGRHSRVIGAAVKKAKEASARCHAEWRAAKEQAKKPRKPSERRALLPPFNPLESEP